LAIWFALERLGMLLRHWLDLGFIRRELATAHNGPTVANRWAARPRSLQRGVLTQCGHHLRDLHQSVWLDQGREHLDRRADSAVRCQMAMAGDWCLL